MRRLTAVLASVALLACGAEPTSLGGGSAEPTLSIVSGNEQEVQVTDTLPFDAEVQLMQGGDPVPDQLADWVVTVDNCGSPFVSSTESDGRGIVRNRAVAGTRAHTTIESPSFCRMEVRWIDQSTGEAITDTTIRYRALPGPIEVNDMAPGSVIERAASDSTVRMSTLWLEDAHENPISYDARATSGPFSVEVNQQIDRDADWPVVVLEDTIGDGSLEVLHADTVLSEAYLSIDPRGATVTDNETGEVDTVPALCMEFGASSASEAESC